MYRLVFGDDEVTMRCVNLALSLVVSMGFAALATRIAVDPSSRYPTLEKGSREQTRKGNDNSFNCRLQLVQTTLFLSLFSYWFSFFVLSLCPPACLLPSLLYLFFNCATARAVHGRRAVVPIIKKICYFFLSFYFGGENGAHSLTNPCYPPFCS